MQFGSGPDQGQVISLSCNFLQLSKLENVTTALISRKKKTYWLVIKKTKQLKTASSLGNIAALGTHEAEALQQAEEDNLCEFAF